MSFLSLSILLYRFSCCYPYTSSSFLVFPITSIRFSLPFSIVFPFPLTITPLLIDTMDYPFYLSLYYYITRKTYPTDADEKTKKRIRFHANKYQAYRGRLYAKGEDDEPGLELLHEGNADEVIKTVHEEGHVGINNTWRKLRMAYTGPCLFERVRTIVQSCESCQFRARIQAKRHEQARPIPTPSHPFFMVGCDAVGPIKMDGKPDKYLLVAIDYLTRWPIARVVTDITEGTTADFLFDELVSMYGVPRYLLTDRGSNFKSAYVHAFLKSLGCRHITTTAYRPQTNGMCERMNQTIVQTIAKLARDQDSMQDWEQFVKPALLAIRTTPNEATRFSPAMLLFGYELRTPAVWPAPRQDYVEGEIADELAARAKVIKLLTDQLRQQACENAQHRKEQDKKRYDAQVRNRRRFRVGEQVLMRDRHPPSKFADRWLGPLIVVQEFKNGTYMLEGPNSRRLKGAVHGDNLRPFVSRRHLIPDVQVKQAEQQFQAWLERGDDDSF